MACCCSLYFTLFMKFGTYLFGTRGGSQSWREVCLKIPLGWLWASWLLSCGREEALWVCWRPCPSRCEWAGCVCGLWAFAHNQPAVFFSSILSMSFPFNSSSPHLSPLYTCCRLPVASGPKPNETQPERQSSGPAVYKDYSLHVLRLMWFNWCIHVYNQPKIISKWFPRLDSIIYLNSRRLHSVIK